MKIVGCDFHPSWQQVAVFDPETGEVEERKLLHGDREGRAVLSRAGGPGAGWYRGMWEQPVVYRVG